MFISRVQTCFCKTRRIQPWRLSWSVLKYCEVKC